MGEIAGARGGRRPVGQLVIEVVRELGEADRQLLVSPPLVGSKTPNIATLRHSHHQLAQLLAEGMDQNDAALISGYSVSRVSILRRDPAFAELEAHYQSVRELKFVDVLERMKVLGLSTLDELQARLEEDASGFGNRELMELAELMLVKGRSAPGSRVGVGPQSGTTGAGVVVNVQFVGGEGTAAPTIDGFAEDSR